VTYPILDLQFLTKAKDSEVWKTIILAINTITDEAQFEVDPTGISFRSKDQTKETFLEIFIPNNAFQYYHCPSLLRFGILANEFLRVVERFDSHIPLELSVQGRFIVVTSKGKSERNYRLNLIESKPMVSPLKEITFDTKLIIKTEILAAILDDIRVVSPKITLKTNRGKITTTTFDSANDIGSATVTIGQTRNIPVLSSMLERCNGTYSVNQVSRLLSLIGTFSEFVELEYSNKGPLRLKVILFDSVKIQLYLAPQPDF
jgi:DNA polymerase III sliding clamp (beta) subunit (PCNA family)